ncbi:MAG: phosphotransferase [Defluviitaleaceae bacterium]|nr:phosphotransferase [Defluviitaleaceae bacterium]
MSKLNDVQFDKSELLFVGEGQNGIIYADKNGKAYKFPKHNLALISLKREIEIIEHISNHVSVSVPNYDSSNLHRPIGEAYCTFTFIQGEKLTPDIYKQHRKNLSKQLLQLLDEIHSIPTVDEMPRLKMSFLNLYEEAKELIFPLLADDVKSNVIKRFEQFFQTNNGVNSIDCDCFIHGDFGSSNIIVDRNTGIITGIIDWAEATIDNPAFDYSSLTCAVGVPECKADLLKLRPSLSSLFEASEFIQYTFPFQAAILGIKTNDNGELADGLSAINCIKN